MTNNNQQVISNVFNLCEKLNLMVHADVYHEGVFFDWGLINEEGVVLSLAGLGTPEQIAICEKDNIDFFDIYGLEHMLVELYRDTRNAE